MNSSIALMFTNIQTLQRFLQSMHTIIATILRNMAAIFRGLASIISDIESIPLKMVLMFSNLEKRL